MTNGWDGFDASSLRANLWSFLMALLVGNSTAKCGVWQGDPLTPLIFVLAADLLQAAIYK